MLYTITPSAMKRIEQRFMEETKTESLTLMERAAGHVADACMPYLWHGAKLLALCGTGNNGGDGLAAARILLSRYETLQCVVYQLAGQQSPETAEQTDRLRAYGNRVEFVTVGETAPTIPADCVCAIDALLGTGLSRPLSGAALALAEELNAGDLPVVAVDIPSGLDGETGYAPQGGTVVQADVTVTFHRPKNGLYLGDGPDFCGEITVGDLGIPAGYDDARGFLVMEAEDVIRSPRRKNTHKGSYGKLLAITGSFAMPGAAGISALAALRAGAGMVTVACPRSIAQTVLSICPCATSLPLPDETPWSVLEPALLKADVLIAGCGLGKSHAVSRLIERLIQYLCSRDLPAVLDADALNGLAKYQDEFLSQSLRFPDGVVLTPHLGEAARLLRWPTEQVKLEQARAARELRARYGGSIVLKSATSVLIAQDGEAISRFGTPAMAKAGSGDTLAGILGALLAGREAYGLHGIRLLQTACALHGLAGEAAAKEYGEHGVLATDVCDFIR
ncbi:MAG TPA: NAD(P)H-hydrate dehydratase [Candidatus Limiplasma sp.]|nr:NAD(P)H-hydrate dehydratase [Candidatus Limiplasma sp.]HRX08900.1 NAD(P)H-hydrate dehydratase [Candidatus Limiplasma sp.]